MSLSERLVQDMKAAMKAKDKDTLSVIRTVRASIKNREIERGSELSDEDITDVLSRELKQRNDSLQEFKKAGREDLVTKTEREITVLKRYLPEPLSEEALRKLVKETVKEVGANTRADMGKVMSALMPNVKGRADGKLVNRLVQEELTK